MKWIVGWAVGLWSRVEQLVHEQRMDEMSEPGNWLKKLFSRDRRRAKRKSSVSLVAYYWDGAAPVAHVIRDISLTGLYLLTDERWYPGTVVEMSLQKTGDSGSEQDRAIRVMAKAIRLDSDGVGLAFVLPYRYGHDLPQEVDIKVLKRFLQGVGIKDHQVDARLRNSESRQLGAGMLNPIAGREQVMEMKSLRGESGQVTILTALCIVCLLGFVALAVDVGMMLRSKRILQTAADSAAIAGAAEINYSNVTGAARADSTENGVTHGVNGATVTVNNPPANGPHSHPTNTGYVEVIVSQPQPTFFMNVFNRGSMTVSARAVATNVPAPSCVDTLLSNPTTPTGKKGAPVAVPGIDMSGSATLSLSGCGILDNASGAGGGLTMGGGTTISAAAIGVVGSTSLHPGYSATPAPVTISPITDPLSSLVSAPLASSYSGSCQADPMLSSSISYTIGPSTPTGFVCYNGLTISHSPTVTLNPGLYIINGPNTLSISGGAIINGAGVTFYFVNDASFNISNGATLTLSAPGSGPYHGLLFYQDVNDFAMDSFVGGSAGSLNGIFYLPSANLTFANGNSSTFSTDLVVGSLTMSGNANIVPYAPLSGSSPLSSPRLVE